MSPRTYWPTWPGRCAPSSTIRRAAFAVGCGTIAHRAWCDLLDSRKAATTGSGDSAVLGLLNSVEAREDLLKHLDSECQRELLEAAMNQVRQRVESNTWEAFRLTAQEGLPGAETALRLGLQVAAVFKAKSRVQKMIREEVAKLEGE